MRIYEFQSESWLSKPPEEIFPFFADPSNLGRMTPPWLHFRILTPLPVAMGAGAMIHYRIRVHGIPIRWRTQITDWNPPSGFRDEQLRGPYRLWVHDHRFEPRDGGTLATDHVRYAPRGGALVERLCVRRDIQTIFAYRGLVLKELFDCSYSCNPIS